MKILIGTNNKNKLKQFWRIFGRCGAEGIELVSLKDVGVTDDVEEDEDDLLANAKKKARVYGEQSGLPALADDTGLYVDALGGEPGVHAKRWHEGTEMDRNRKLLDRLKDIPEEKRICRYTGFLVFYDPRTKEFWEYKNDLVGVISDEFKGEHGFGYDPIFKIADGRHYAELADGERDALSHRGRGIEELLKFLSGNGMPHYLPAER